MPRKAKSDDLKAQLEAQANQATEIHIVNVERGQITFYVIGTSPMLHNCLSEKARHELLLPSGRKTRAELQMNLKHNPMEEFRASYYFNKHKGPTLIQHLSSAFRGAMKSAALDLPGVTKAEIGRLLWVEGDRIDIYGIPMIDLRPVRQAGMNRTPDIRTRCITPEWAAKVTVSYTKPQLKEQAVYNLLAAAGIYIGVGDYRNEKGAGNYGLWRICNADDPDFLRIVKTGGRAAQEAAVKSPEPYNEETEELLTWFDRAVKEHRSFAPIKSTKESKRNGTSKQALAAQVAKVKRSWGLENGEPVS
jgi:hypothetical protein